MMIERFMSLSTDGPGGDPSDAVKNAVATASKFGADDGDAADQGPARDPGSFAKRNTRPARRSVILREIARRSSEPKLTAIAIAATLGITPRYVHLLLRATGRSFSHHLAEHRLDRAFALLRNPSWRHRKISDIALEVGFNDLSRFNRAFRRRYDTTPSSVRTAVCPSIALGIKDCQTDGA